MDSPTEASKENEPAFGVGLYARGGIEFDPVDDVSVDAIQAMPSFTKEF